MAKKKTNQGRRALGAVLVVAALFILVALSTHSTADDSLIRGETGAPPNPFQINFANGAGIVGAYFAFVISFLVGWLAWFIPLGLISLALPLVSQSLYERISPRPWLLFFVGLAGSTIANVYNRSAGELLGPRYAVGGFLGDVVSSWSYKLLGELGSYIVAGGLIAILLGIYTYVTPFLLGRLRDVTSEAVSGSELGIVARFKRGITLTSLRERITAWRAGRAERAAAAVSESSVQPEDGLAELNSDAERAEKAPRRSLRKAVLKKAAEPVQIRSMAYSYPSLDLLDPVPADTGAVTPDELALTSRMLKETLETFGVTIEGQIERYPGPVITRYEFKPGVGIKVNQIVNLADDLALALKAKRIRIIAPIPGKAAVGVEIPNRIQQRVYLREILSADEFRDPTIRLPLALGKTTAGKPFVTDLSRMPHLLIAGATGSGKSVCMNVLITSFMYRLHPLHIRFVFVDPKMLELSVYSGIPHLGRPVVTTPKQAERVFADAVNEMESRYRRLAAASVRNIEDYNRRQEKEEEKLPYLVIFVDELADLMMSSTSSKTEMMITRLAQMARAVGIHLILATQRPSVDVITGLIKANFPARIAFQVSSKVDSRTIIDGNGAEKLLGAGDMLFLSAGQPEPIRIHGAYLSSEETDRLVSFIKGQGIGMLALDSISQATSDSADADIDLGDPLFREACEVVVRHKQGSVSLLQRRLGIGYQRAARLIDKLEQAGVVSPFDGSKAREVIVDQRYLETMFGPGSKVADTEAEPR